MLNTLRNKKIIILSCSLLLLATAFTACGGASPTTVPPTSASNSAPTLAATTGASNSAPTSVPPTKAALAAATAVPTNANPTSVATSASPTNTPSGASQTGAGGNGTQAIVALSKFMVAPSYRLEGEAHVSKPFFGGRDYVGNGTDPNQVTIFTLKGEQNNVDMNYEMGGFWGSLMAYTSDFDEKSPNFEITRVGDTRYIRGTLPGDTAAKWYQLTTTQALSNGIGQFDPKVELFQPILIGSAGPVADITKTGTDTLDNHACDVYSLARHEFDSTLAQLSENMILKSDVVDTTSVDNFGYKVWVCDDGNLHQVQFTFDAHSKTQPDQKGTFDFKLHMYDYDTPIAIQAPTDAVPFGSSSIAQEQPTVAADATDTPEATKSAGGKYDGDWQGYNADEGAEITFRVENNQITQMLINYKYKVGDCSGGAGSLSSVDHATITGDTFTATHTDSDNTVYTLVGTFTSPTEANGTQEVQGKTHGCNNQAFDANDTWTAVNTTLVGTPTPPPTQPETTSGPSAESLKDPSNYAMGLFMSADLNQLDKFSNYIADNVAYTFGTTNGTGKTKLVAYLREIVNGGAQFQPVGNPTTSGNVSKFGIKVVGGAHPVTYQSCTLTIAEQKVTDLMCK